MTFLNESELICLFTVKWFQVLLTNIFICTHLNGFENYYIIQMIQFNSHLFAHC